MIDDDLTLRVSTCTANLGAPMGSDTFTLSNTRDIIGWTNISVGRGIERCPSGFEIEFTEPLDGRSEVIVQAGDYCEVLLGKDIVLTGFVDRYMPSYSANQHTTRISGRSKCQDIVDCSIVTARGMQFENMHLLDIARQLCAPYRVKINLASGADQGPLIEYVFVLIGESPFDVIERLSRLLGFLLYDLPDGSLLISRTGTILSASGFTEGINVLAAAAMYSMDGRFSEYQVFRQNLDTMQDIGNGGNLLVEKFDTRVPRFRHRAIIAEYPVGGQDMAEKTAQWELNRRIGRSFQVRLTTDSWRDSSGALYAPNTLVPVDLPGLKMKTVNTWLIADVTYRKGQGGTLCDLTIMPPDAFQQKPFFLYPPINTDIGRG